MVDKCGLYGILLTKLVLYLAGFTSIWRENQHFSQRLGTPTTMNRLLSMIWGLRESCCGRFAARIWATIHYEKQDAFLGGLPPNQVLIDETKLREQVNHDMAKVRCPSKRDSLYSWLVHITYPHVWQTHVSYTDSINVPMPWVIKCPHWTSPNH